MEELTKKQREEQARLLREGSGWDCYWFAYEIVEGVDVCALCQRVAEVGTGADCCNFATLKGADVQALQARVLTVGEKWELREFTSIKGADVQALKEKINILNTWTAYNYC